MKKLLDNRGQISTLLIWIYQFNLTNKSFHDPRLNSMIGQPYTMGSIPIICSSIANGVCAHLKKSKKALIIDLDNTIWGDNW